MTQRACKSRNLFRFAFMTLMAGFLLLSMVDSAYAVTGTGPGNSARSGDLEAKGPTGVAKKCSEYGVLTGAIIPCIMYTVETTGKVYAEKFAAMMMPAVMAFLTLAITFFGLKLLQGEGQIGPKALLFLLKIAFVVGFLQLMPSLIAPVHSIMRESSEILAGVLAKPGKFSCDYAAYLKPGGELIWAQMDCVVGKLFGFMVADPTKEPNMLLAASGLGLLGGFLAGGTFGMFVFFALLGVLFTLFNFVVKTLLGYLNGFLIATLLIIISPLFLPLALLQPTAQYFDKWWKGIVAAMLMPVLITGYVVLALMLYDHVLLRDGSILKQIFDPDFMQQFQVMNNQRCVDSPVNSPTISAETSVASGNTSDEARHALVSANPIFQTNTGQGGTCFEVNDIQMHADQLEELFIQLMILIVVVAVVEEGFRVVQQSVRNITGSSMVSAALDAVSSMEKKTEAAMQGFKQGMYQAKDDQGRNIGDLRGADFLGSVRHGFGGGIQGFMAQMRRPGSDF